MTSEIVIESIDVDYPVSGQDNDSQGFRDNFSAISNALATAASEITVLQTTAAKLNDTNNFLGNIIQNAVTQNVYNYAYSFTGNTVNVMDGNYQIVTLTSNTLNLTNWPEYDTPACVNLRLVINSSDILRTVSITSANSEFIKTTFGGSLTIPANSLAVLDIWSHDTGVNVFVHNVGVFA